MMGKVSWLVGIARVLATEAHAGRTDKAGVAYITHPQRVARRVRTAGYDDEFVAVAWLHDVIEDCKSISAADLTSLGFPPEVVDGVVAMTKRPGDEGSEAVERAAANRLGLVCKAADVADNTDPDRQALLATVDPSMVARHQQKYAMYREVLKGHGAPAF
jgi:(p)ppGpp synthase/HD superfamily hydrolase